MNYIIYVINSEGAALNNMFMNDRYHYALNRRKKSEKNLNG